MVVALGPGKFYGSSLPRPRIYTDVKLNDERIDPPVPVLDPLMSWAEEARWSMGGLNSTRLRLQGRIEGSVIKLRAERERSIVKRNMQSEINQISNKPSKRSSPLPLPSLSPSPPPAPLAIKRRRRILVGEDEESEGGERESVKRGPARNLWDDFDRVAEESGLKREIDRSEGVATRSRSQISKNVEVKSESNSKGSKLKLTGKAKTRGDNGTSVSPGLAESI